MISIGDFMTAGHKGCDEAFARAEDAAGDPARAAAAVTAFRAALEQHFAMEEQVLFPAFEQETGMGDGGPTFAMRAEHDQMRGLVEQLVHAAAAHDERQYLGVADTLLVLMQQHNLKEEAMMYPMLDAAMADRAPDLLASCAALDTARA